MCTVTFIPGKHAVFLTSNRDEKAVRRPALPPRMYNANHGCLLYPKDGAAGGSWIALCTNGNAGVLLNGAFEKHSLQGSYRKSRGLVFLELMDNHHPFTAFQQSNLQDIEPFTLVLYQQRKLYECRWDGTSKHYRMLPANQPQIWSSVTLYSEAVRNRRQQWFRQWLQQKQQPTQSDILHFHRFAGEGDAQNDLLMNRDGTLFTVSITGMEITAGRGSMVYTDLIKKEKATASIGFSDNLIFL